MKWLASAANAPLRLKLVLGLFFLALAAPTLVLVVHAYRQLKWEAVHQHRVMAEELSRRVDQRLQGLIRNEEARGYGEFSFITVEGNLAANYAQRSDLSRYPVQSELPGLIGWFQVDADGRYTTPLLPDADPATFGIDAADLAGRRALAERIRDVLVDHRLVARDVPASPVVGLDTDEAPKEAVAAEADDADASLELEEALPPSRRRNRRAAEAESEPPAGQALFDRLTEQKASRAPRKQEDLGRVEDLRLDRLESTRDREGGEFRAQAAAPSPAPERQKRVEQAIVAELPAAAEPDTGASGEAQNELRVRTFESEIDPFEMALLDSGHLVLFRKVWQEDQRIIQGALIDGADFIAGLIADEFRGTALARAADLVVAWQGDILELVPGVQARSRPGYDASFSAEDLAGTLLYQTSLSPPLGALSLTYTISRLPAGPGAAVVNWMAAMMALVLIGGFFALYRLGMRQISLVRQQQDFVSAVSHELKTPLTSIRMYSEMLKAGWADEDKKRGYYDFIYDESERLSRLIANVLQLARMSRGNLGLKLEPHRIAELQDMVRSRVGAHAERAGFEFRMSCPDGLQDATIEVDPDAFVQVFINLVDNALKFAANSEPKVIDIGCERSGDAIAFTVRDYGPGVPRDQMKKIFRLFYRAENELTRETVGTGIGLALVRELVTAMGGRVDVRNRDPGAELEIRLPSVAK